VSRTYLDSFFIATEELGLELSGEESKVVNLPSPDLKSLSSAVSQNQRDGR
jgi:hypothetical protein